MKSLFLLLIIVNIAFSQVETVSVGKIDKQYSGLLSKDSLIKTIKEIESLFEQQLGFKVFNYKQKGGKPIDIIYMPPSRKKKRIIQNQKKSELLKMKIDDLGMSLSHKQTLINSTKNDLERAYENLNRQIRQLDSYISRKKSLRKLSKHDYDKIKRYVSKEQDKVKKRTKELNRKKRQYNSKTLSLRSQLHKYNSLISRYNYFQRDIEKLSKSYKEIKGKTKRRMKTIYTTFTENGNSTTKEDYKSDSEKIEIYNFENLNLLKVILAHEIGHLVGVEHINTIGALMHPYLQKEQINNLKLTTDDINAFSESFK